MSARAPGTPFSLRGEGTPQMLHRVFPEQRLRSAELPAGWRLILALPRNHEDATSLVLQGSVVL